jgi:hypothetical protein
VPNCCTWTPRWCSHGWLETGPLARPSALPADLRAAEVRAERADVAVRPAWPALALLAVLVVRPESAERVELAADLVDVDLVDVDLLDDLVDGLLAPDVLGGTDSPYPPRDAGGRAPRDRGHMPLDATAKTTPPPEGDG